MSVRVVGVEWEEEVGGGRGNDGGREGGEKRKRNIIDRIVRRDGPQRPVRPAPDTVLGGD